MSPVSMAQSIHDEMEFPGSVSTTLVSWATGVVDELKNAISNGTCDGTCPPNGGPLSNGRSSGGSISNVDKTAMAQSIADSAYGGVATPKLIDFCDAIATHFMSGTISIDSGGVIGSCTNTITSPGVFSGVGSNGYIVGLDGGTLASLVKTKLGFTDVSLKLLQKCTAIVNYLLANVVVEYSSATGIAPAGGGPLTSGVVTESTFS